MTEAFSHKLAKHWQKVPIGVAEKILPLTYQTEYSLPKTLV